MKPFTGIERGQFRLEIAQRNHLGLAIRAFVRFVDFAKYSDLQWVFTHYELSEHLYHKVKQRAVATNQDESEYEMYRLIIAALEHEFGGSS